MPDSLTRQEILAASAYFEAVWEEDTEALGALMRRGDGEQPMPRLVAEFGSGIIHALVFETAGFHDGMSGAERQAAQERLVTDPAVQVSLLLADTLTELSWSADAEQTATIARSVIGYLTRTGGEVPQERVLPLIGAMRDKALGKAI
ncbi:hypothetical protein ACFWNG_06070 [Streptomyces sp. NPDC058391]|uniref:hypothetical protein n=1 Tax=Streptomyces sp. NPDC058391 TaxID=3346476 RepID=UPI003664E7B0